METAMQNETFETKCTPEGAIDVRHYARVAAAERRETRNAAIRTLSRASKRAILAIGGFLMFWNIPPMGSSASKEMPYR
jgi:hypothetical protein